MSEPEDIAKVVKALQKVAEKHLLIIDLANEMAGEEGELNYGQLASRQREVNLAVAEAKVYSNATVRAVEALKRLEARPGGVM